ncbi:hypothetical protein [Companilactobacillus mishanensis]|uniref:Uncharacterized protein n=1 Tax=Companilactobacillus mishanensis TaxID=2486008 RepID=A0A5P0ZGI1_9LACO|nr:hypothetical protein [Companilactobacillus mishanensis]MQS52119.1 hypothetical protein [Companilactobacillus mishanensis]MQS88207.1 hypothetical protein [Companilactobacillus mishanensis]
MKLNRYLHNSLYADDPTFGYRYIYDRKNKKMMVYGLPAEPTKALTGIIGMLSTAVAAMGGTWYAVPFILKGSGKLNLNNIGIITVLTLFLSIILVPIYQIWFESSIERCGELKDVEIKQKSLIQATNYYQDQILMDFEGDNKKSFLKNSRKSLFFKGELPIIFVYFGLIYILFTADEVLPFIVFLFILLIVSSLTTYMFVFAHWKISIMSKVLFPDE